MTPAAREIANPSNEILVSPASYWEIAIKISIGKYKLSMPYKDFWHDAFEAYSINILPIELRHTDRLVALPFHHKDPFDVGCDCCKTDESHSNQQACSRHSAGGLTRQISGGIGRTEFPVSHLPAEPSARGDGVGNASIFAKVKLASKIFLTRAMDCAYVDSTLKKDRISAIDIDARAFF